MRTTLNLPDDVYRVARSVADLQGISLGEAVARLIRQALAPPPLMGADTPFPSFAVSEDSPPITLEQTLAAEDEV